MDDDSFVFKKAQLLAKSGPVPFIELVEIECATSNFRFLVREEAVGHIPTVHLRRLYDVLPTEGEIGPYVIHSVLGKPRRPPLVVVGILIQVERDVGQTAEGEERFPVVEEVGAFGADFGYFESGLRMSSDRGLVWCQVRS